MHALIHLFATLLLALQVQEAPRAVDSPATTRPSTQPVDYITTQPGELPILISAPHGGTLRIPGVEQRTGKNVAKKRGAKSNFSFAFDRNTDKVAFALADAIEAKTGKRPYLVVAHFTRRHIDANRTAEDAYENPRAGLIYDQYHDTIKSFRQQIITDFGRGILIDVHGHGGDPNAIIRGSADWQTTRHLVDTFGKDAVVGPTGFFGPLHDRGYLLVPANQDVDAKENPALNGGFIVREYGSFVGGNFDAIQLELGNSLRRPERIPEFTNDLADAVVSFSDLYLTGPLPATQPTTEPATQNADPAVAP